jgi:hypothetical protein
VGLISGGFLGEDLLTQGQALIADPGLTGRYQPGHLVVGFGAEAAPFLVRAGCELSDGRLPWPVPGPPLLASGELAYQLPVLCASSPTSRRIASMASQMSVKRLVIGAGPSRSRPGAR